jgi:DNA replication protein DnaC
VTHRDQLQELLIKVGMKYAAEAVPVLLKEASDKHHSFTWLLTKLLELELDGRRRRATENREHRARFPENWTLKTFPWELQPGVDQREIMELAELLFVREAANLVFLGEVGVGKTGLAIGLGREAVEAGYGVLFIKIHDLVDQLTASLMDRSTLRLLRRLARIDILVIDEFSHVKLTEEQANLLFRLVDARYHKKSTIFTTNLGFDDWGQYLNNPVLTRSLASRVTDQCFVIRIDGPPIRPGPRPRPASRQQAGRTAVQETTGEEEKKDSPEVRHARGKKGRSGQGSKE